MADGKIKISELEEALQISDNAQIPYSQENGGVQTTFKGPVSQIARKIAEGITFTNLTTTAKTLVGAINELKALGSPILLGTTSPTSSQGADGNIYVQYTEGTGGASDTVDSIYAKIDGAWCEFQTGGGGGTSDYEDLSNKPQVNSVELVGNKSLDDLGIMPASLSKTVSGSLVHIEDGADNIPVKSLVSEIVAVESGNGQPKSPSNPYTISGFDSGIVTRCGKNLFDGSKVTTTNTSNWGVSYDSSTNILTIEHKTTYGSGMPKFDIPSFVGDLVISGNFGATIDLYMNGSWVRSMPSGVSFTCTSGNKYSLLFPNNSQSTLTYKVQLEIGDTSSEFEQYNGNTYTFAFGQTVYGGHFDNNGNLVVTHGYKDLGTLNYTMYSVAQGNLFRSDEFDIKRVTQSTEVPNIISSIFVAASNASRANYTISMVNGSARIDIVDNDYSDANAFKTAMSGVQLVYELVNPITLSITSQDIPTLLGENNIFSSTGDVEVTYYISNSDDIAGLIKSVGSGGHTIVDDSGTALTQRTKLQFNGAYSEDNATDDTTEVNVVREMTKAEFDLLSADEKTGFINITDITGGNDDRFQPVIYSSEEREIGVWKDGKPLYQKTYNATFTNIASDTPQTVADISSIGIDTLVTLDGSCAYTTEGFTFSSSLGGYFFCYAYPTGNLTFSQTMTQQTTGRTYVVEATLYYTKTTDTVGSGQWTPQGVPTHHYSEDEQVVGTWIDGSTLYEKTYTIADLDYSTSENFKELFTVPDADTIINISGRLTNSSHTSQYPIPYCSSNSKYAIVVFEDTASHGNAKSFFFRSNDTWADGSLLVVVQYTKSA